MEKIRLGHNGEILSTTTYYDTFVSFLIQPIEIQKGERKNYKIYWTVDKKYEKKIFDNNLSIIYE